jgi:biotin/methionine sulfoxide reductase
LELDQTVRKPRFGGRAETEYTVGHWGTHEIVRDENGSPALRHWRGDADPSPVGLDQLSPVTDAMRVKRPAFRRGWLEHGPGGRTQARGSDEFVELEWDEALDIVARELSRVTSRYGNEALFGGSYGWASAGRFHHAQSQIHRFLNTIGGYVRSRDSYSYAAGTVVMPHIVAPLDALLDQHTDWASLHGHTELFVAFGGLPLKNARMTAGGPGRHRVRGELQRLADAGTRFVNVSPLRRDVAGASSWMPIRPNTDTALMLALCHVLLVEGLHDREFLARYCAGFEKVEAYLLGKDDGQPKDAPWAEAITGVPGHEIVALALEMARSRTMINASWSLQRQRHGEQPYWALVTLAAMLGQIGLPGGGFGVGYGTMNSVGSAERRMAGPRLPQGRNRVDAFIPVARIADMLLDPGGSFDYDGASHAYPHIRLVYWAGGNPFHHHQDLNRLIAAWRRPETIIVHEQFWTATARAADIVLPASSALEREDIGYAAREGQIVAMRKLREPLGQSRSDFGIFADLASRMHVRAAFTEGLDERGWLRRIYEDCRRDARPAVELPPFEDFWRSGHVELPPSDPTIMLEAFRHDPGRNPLPTPTGLIELHSATVAGFGYADCPGHAAWLDPGEWLGSPAAATHPLHLLSNQPSRRLHSQLDNGEFSRAGKIAGREPVLISAADAAARGIEDGDVVRIFNARGACLAGAEVTDDLMPGVVIMATGAWFDPVEWTPENPLDRHGNPNVLTGDVGTSLLSQGTSAQTCLVEIERFNGEWPAVRAFDPPRLVTPDGL